MLIYYINSAAAEAAHASARPKESGDDAALLIHHASDAGVGRNVFHTGGVVGSFVGL